MIREITIKPVLNGFVCKVGCQTVVFNSARELAENIERYYKNPDAVEKDFIAKAVNKTMDEYPAPECGEPCVVDPRPDCNPCCESPRPIGGALREVRR